MSFDKEVKINVIHPVMYKVGHFLNVRVIVDSRQSVEFFEVRVGGR